MSRKRPKLEATHESVQAFLSYLTEDLELSANQIKEYRGVASAMTTSIRARYGENEIDDIRKLLDELKQAKQELLELQESERKKLT